MWLTELRGPTDDSVSGLRRVHPKTRPGAHRNVSPNVVVNVHGRADFSFPLGDRNLVSLQKVNCIGTPSQEVVLYRKVSGQGSLEPFVDL